MTSTRSFKRPHDRFFEELKTKGLPPMSKTKGFSAKADHGEESGALATPKASQVTLFGMKAVHGLLVHPYTGARFTKDKALAHELDIWCEIQIEAGKLVQV